MHTFILEHKHKHTHKHSGTRRQKHCTCAHLHMLGISFVLPSSSGDSINWVHVWLIVQTYEAAERRVNRKRSRSPHQQNPEEILTKKHGIHNKRYATQNMVKLEKSRSNSTTKQPEVYQVLQNTQRRWRCREIKRTKNYHHHTRALLCRAMFYRHRQTNEWNRERKGKKW